MMSNNDESIYDEMLWEIEGQCQACETFAVVNDLGLCEDCGAKLERDLIRQRTWDYSATAFGLAATQRETLRAQVIAKYGKALELIVE
jgi:hypothetical protein